MTIATDSPLETVYRPAEPVDLRLTLGALARGGGDPTHRWVGSALWRTINTDAGPATLRLVATREGIAASAWGAGAGLALDSVPELCGAGDDWSGLDLRGHPVLAETLRRSPGLRLHRTGRVFEALVGAILEQKVTGMEAWRGWRAILRTFGIPAPGPAPEGMRVFPDAATVRRIPSWEWHRAGVGPQRSDTVMRVAQVAESLERTIALGRGGPEVERRLRSVRGVGVWTAAETAQRAHGDPDAPSFGDFHVPRQVGLACAGHEVDDDGMRELLEPFAGHRQRVVRLILRAGIGAERRGPRATIRDYRAI